MEGNSTTIWDVADEERSKRSYTFDYSYWSHDGFHLAENGLSVPDNPKYEEQRRM